MSLPNGKLQVTPIHQTLAACNKAEKQLYAVDKNFFQDMVGFNDIVTCIMRRYEPALMYVHWIQPVRKDIFYCQYMANRINRKQKEARKYCAENPSDIETNGHALQF